MVGEDVVDDPMTVLLSRPKNVDLITANASFTLEGAIYNLLKTCLLKGSSCVEGIYNSETGRSAHLITTI